MAIITNRGHVSRALDFYKKQDVFFSVGKSTEWTESDRTSETPDSQVITDYKPPRPSLDSSMIELLGMKRVERMYMVVPDETGTLRYGNTNWKPVDVSSALEKNARWVYMSTNLLYNELSVDVSYRTIGISTGVVRNAGVDENKYLLTPDEIKSEGILEIIDFRKPIFRDTDQREELAIVIEF